MAAESDVHDPFSDHAAITHNHSLNAESTLSVGRNATLTLGTDALIVLGMLAHTMTGLADRIQMMGFETRVQSAAVCCIKVSLVFDIWAPQLMRCRFSEHQINTILQHPLGRDQQNRTHHPFRETILEAVGCRLLPALYTRQLCA